MAERDELRVLLPDCAAPRPLPTATRDRLAAAIAAVGESAPVDEDESGLAALLRGAAGARPVSDATRAAIHARLLGGPPSRPLARLGFRAGAAASRRLSLAVVSAAAAVALIGTATVVVRPATDSDRVAQPRVSTPATTPAPVAGGSSVPEPQPVPPTSVVPEAPGVDEPPPSAGPIVSPSGTAPGPSRTPRPDGPPGAPGAPAEPGAGRPPPQAGIHGVDPDVGPLAGGTAVSIYGMGLSSAVRVEVGGRRATELRVVSDSELTARTPAGAQAGKVSVVVVLADGGRYGLSPGFTYVAPPVLDSVSPDAGPASGGNYVTLSGDHFRADSVVRFGGAQAEVQDVTRNTIGVIVPGHLPGPVDVTVTTQGGTSAARRYTYLPG